MKSPCKDCPERYVGCHSECGKYKYFRRKLEAQNEVIRANRTEHIRRLERIQRVKDGTGRK